MNSDGDGALDLVDNCVNVANPSQSDVDNDGIGEIGYLIIFTLYMLTGSLFTLCVILSSPS